MKATELRIGNYIEKSLKSGQGRNVIDRVTFTNLQRIFEESGSMNFKPIPLTEEILLKCGFVKKNSTWYEKGFFCINISLDIEWKYNWIGVSVKYLHQLQNLYFTLTGQELKINL